MVLTHVCDIPDYNFHSGANDAGAMKPEEGGYYTLYSCITIRTVGMIVTDVVGSRKKRIWSSNLSKSIKIVYI